MPTTAEERFQAVAENWFATMNGYYADMAATKTVDDAKAVEANYRAAEMAYLEALEKGLKGGGGDVDTALAALKKANAAVKKSRENGEAIGKLLVKAKDATEKATKLVERAAGA